MGNCVGWNDVYRPCPHVERKGERHKLAGSDRIPIVLSQPGGTYVVYICLYGVPTGVPTTMATIVEKD